jgi:hypothetical protein
LYKANSATVRITQATIPTPKAGVKPWMGKRNPVTLVSAVVKRNSAVVTGYLSEANIPPTTISPLPIAIRVMMTCKMVKAPTSLPRIMAIPVVGHSLAEKVGDLVANYSRDFRIEQNIAAYRQDLTTGGCDELQSKPCAQGHRPGPRRIRREARRPVHGPQPDAGGAVAPAGRFLSGNLGTRRREPATPRRVGRVPNGWRRKRFQSD